MPPDTKFIQVHLFPKAYFCRLNGQTGGVNNSELIVFLNEDTPWKINMEPKNGGLEDDFPFQLGDF